MEKTTWKKIPGYETYFVSDKGDVVSTVRYVYSRKHNGAIPHQRVKMLSPCIEKNGYVYIGIGSASEGNRKMMKVHRLVAMAFLPNPNNYPEVNHINGDKADNRVENLEWVTASENVKHSYRIGLNRRSEIRDNLFMKNRKVNDIPVVAIDGMMVERKFKNMQECADFIGVDRSCVSRAAKSGRKTRGYIIQMA